MVHAAREVFIPFLPDVHIFTDHKDGQQAGEYILNLDSIIILRGGIYLMN